MLVFGFVLTAALAACGDSDGGADGGGTSSTTQASGGGATGSVVTVIAQDIKWKEGELAAKAGSINIELVNEGRTNHAFVIDGYEDDLKLKVNSKGDKDSGTIDLDAGEYDFYCDIPGHRAAGMEGTLTVS